MNPRGGYPEVMIVQRVLPWATSTMGGIEEGDIIWGINSEFLGSDLLRLANILDKEADKFVEINLQRNGKPLTSRTFVREINQYKQNHFVKWAGATFQDITPALYSMTRCSIPSSVFMVSADVGTTFRNVGLNDDNSKSIAISEIDTEKTFSLKQLIEL